MKRFTEEHEWVEIDGDIATIGISAHAAKELGDITFIDMPETDVEIAQGDVLTVVESVKAASDVFSPLSGIVSEVNPALEKNPEVMNESPEHDGWICRMSRINTDELSGLMTEEEYSDFVG